MGLVYTPTGEDDNHQLEEEIPNIKYSAEGSSLTVDAYGHVSAHAWMAEFEVTVFQRFDMGNRVGDRLLCMSERW